MHGGLLPGDEFAVEPYIGCGGNWHDVWLLDRALGKPGNFLAAIGVGAGGTAVRQLDAVDDFEQRAACGLDDIGTDAGAANDTEIVDDDVAKVADKLIMLKS